MSEKIVTPRDVFGWTVGTLVTTVVAGMAGWFTGSLPVVWEFAVSNAFEAFLWTALFLLIGIVIGTFIRGHIDRKQLTAIREEYEVPARKIREKAAGMSDAAKAILAYCIEAPAPPMFEGVGDAGTITRGMLEVRDSGLVKWDPVGGVAAVVTVLPEVRAAITDDDELMDSMKKTLSMYRYELVERNHGTLTNLSARSEFGISGLSPAESKMVMDIWNGGSVHVGIKGLPVAKALKSRGVIYRLDAPSSGVIEECDVVLTDEWRQKVEEAVREK